MERLTTKVFESLGAASMCWSETPKGEFDSSKAREIGDALMNEIRAQISNHRTDGLTFGQAVELMKAGQALQRDGWNGKGMYVVHQKGYPDGIAINKNTAEATKQPEGTVCKFRPYLMMRTADGSFVPWVASQTDILAEDWQCLPQTA